MKFSPNVICSHIDGMVTDAQKTEFEAAIANAYASHLPLFTRAKVIWMAIPPQQAYLEEAQSTASTLMVPVPNGTLNAQRHPMLLQLLNAWCDIMQCDKNQVVISAPDVALSSAFLRASRRRMPFHYQVVFLVKTLIRLVSSKRDNGHLNTHINL